ncbi:MAG: lysophospholipid acyltransferase family protein [Cyanobacteria bacterium J06641_5]
MEFQNHLLYHLFKWSIVSPVLHTYFRVRIHGAEHVPPTGPLTVVSNHASNFDPPIVSNCVRRPVAYMAKEELFRIPIFKQAIQLYGAYPVRRGAVARQAMQTAQDFLKQGWAIGIFLQGTRTPDGRIDKPKLGAANIAAKVQSPLLPVSLWGTEKILQAGSPLPHPVPLTIRIGEAIAPPASSDRDDLQATTDRLTTTINALHALGR